MKFIDISKRIPADKKFISENGKWGIEELAPRNRPGVCLFSFGVENVAIARLPPAVGRSRLAAMKDFLYGLDDAIRNYQGLVEELELMIEDEEDNARREADHE